MRKGILVAALVLVSSPVSLSSVAQASPLESVVKAVTGSTTKTVDSVGNAVEKSIDALKGQPRIKNSEISTKVNAEHARIMQLGKGGKLNIGTKVRNANINNSHIKTKINIKHAHIIQKGESGELTIGTDIE